MQGRKVMRQVDASLTRWVECKGEGHNWSCRAARVDDVPSPPTQVFAWAGAPFGALWRIVIDDRWRTKAAGLAGKRIACPYSADQCLQYFLRLGARLAALQGQFVAVKHGQLKIPHRMTEQVADGLCVASSITRPNWKQVTPH